MNLYDKKREELGIDKQIEAFFKKGGKITKCEPGQQTLNLKTLAFNNKKKDGTKLIRN